MNNKCNKKLLSSILLALSLSSGISINDKIANANYKGEDRSNLNKFVSGIKDSKENASEVAKNLFKAINGIYQNRCQHNKNSVLYKSMQANMKLSLNDVNISKYNQYGPDALKAMILELGVDKFKGGHFTVWNEQIKNYVNNALEQINCCDAWFWALGGTENDIEEYKEKVKAKEFTKIFGCYANNENQIKKEVGAFQNLNNFKGICVINNDSIRAWGKAKKFDSNITEKQKVLNHVLKVYELDKNNYRQGMSFWGDIIIDKFVGCKNREISPETEAEIYYVYKTIMDKINKILDIIALAKETKDRSLTTEYSDFISKIKNTENLELPEMLRPNNKDNPLTDPLILSSIFSSFINFLDRNLRIQLLDEMIYKGDFQSQSDEYIISKRIIDEGHKAIINFDDRNNRLKNTFNGVDSNDIDNKLNYCHFIIQELTKNTGELNFSNDI